MVSFLLVVKAGMLLGTAHTVPPAVLRVLVVLAHHRAAANFVTAHFDSALILGLFWAVFEVALGSATWLMPHANDALLRRHHLLLALIYGNTDGHFLLVLLATWILFRHLVYYLLL